MYALGPIGVDEEDGDVNGLDDEASAVDGDDEEAVGMDEGHAVQHPQCAIEQRYHIRGRYEL